MARRALTADAKRSALVNFRISSAQLVCIEREATAAGMALPDYVRAVLTGRRRRASQWLRKSGGDRPATWREDRRLAVRMTQADADHLRERAERVNATLGHYARSVLAGHRPRARHVLHPQIGTLVYELQSLAANFRQLHAVLRAAAYEDWRRHVGVVLPLELTSPLVDSEVVSRHIRSINRAGQQLNHLAFLANSGQTFSEADEERVLDAVADAIEALEADLPGRGGSGNGVGA